MWPVFVVIAGALMVALPSWLWERYKPIPWANEMGDEFGLNRFRWEPGDRWIKRVMDGHSRAVAVARALVDEAERVGTFTYFPPYCRPAIPDGVTWTTGIAFFAKGHIPYVAWLPNAHPLAVEYRKAHGKVRLEELKLNGDQ